MKNFLKRLFCNHSFRLVGEYKYKDGRIENLYICSKCWKQKVGD